MSNDSGIIEIKKDSRIIAINDVYKELSVQNPFIQSAWFEKKLSEYPTIQPYDMRSFVETCLLYNADPRKREIYLVPYNKKVNGLWVNSFEPIVAYQFYIKRAQECGGYDGHQVTSSIVDYFNPITGEIEKTIEAIATVYIKDVLNPVKYPARFNEFAKKNKDGNVFGTWAKMPYLMIEKCALCNAMRQAFPKDLHGLYTDVEIKGEEVEIKRGEVKKIWTYQELPNSLKELITIMGSKDARDDFFNNEDIDQSKLAELGEDEKEHLICQAKDYILMHQE